MRKNFGVKTYLYPQPVLIIGTYDENKKANAMNAAWGGICDYDKICIDLGEHKTTDNIALYKAFTVACGDAAHVRECDYVGIVSGKDEDKMEKVKWDYIDSEFVNAPVFIDLPVTLECEFIDILEDGLYRGKIVNVSCDEKYLGIDGLPDLSKFTPITFDPVHNQYVGLGEVIADAFAEGKKLKD